MVMTNANRESIRAASQPAEMERWVMRITPPHVIRLDGKFLNLTGQSVEQAPETAGRK